MKIMKHGNVIQKECQRKKKWKSIINIKPLLMAMLIYDNGFHSYYICMVMRNRNNYEDSKFILDNSGLLLLCDDSDDKNYISILF